MAPIVMVIASVVTFSVHMILGFDLTAAQVSEPSWLGKISRYHIQRCSGTLVSGFGSSSNNQKVLFSFVSLNQEVEG